MAEDQTKRTPTVLAISKGGELCWFCLWPHQPGETYIRVNSPDNRAHYSSCLFCYDKVLTTTNKLEKREELTMPDKKDPKPSYPTPRSFGDTKAGRKDWDCTHAEIVNNEVVILAAEPVRTQYGEAYVCQCVVNETPVSILMGATALVNQITDFLDELPVAALLVKPGTYYVFDDPINPTFVE